jgi:hypothetical protein
MAKNRCMCFIYNGFYAFLGMARRIPAVLYIAPHAAHIATAKPYKVCRLPIEIALALQGVKSFHNGQLSWVGRYNFAQRKSKIIVAKKTDARQLTIA